MPQPASFVVLKKQYHVIPGTAEWDEFMDLGVKKLMEMNNEEESLFLKSVYNNDR